MEAGSSCSFSFMKPLARTLALVTAFALVAPGSVAFAQPAPTAAERAEAATRFKTGLDLFKDGDAQAALIEFRRAYQLAPNYQVLYNIGQVSFQLQDYPGALAALQKYLLEGGRNIPNAAPRRGREGHREAPEPGREPRRHRQRARRRRPRRRHQRRQVAAQAERPRRRRQAPRRGEPLRLHEREQARRDRQPGVAEGHLRAHRDPAGDAGADSRAGAGAGRSRASPPRPIRSRPRLPTSGRRTTRRRSSAGARPAR